MNFGILSSISLAIAVILVSYNAFLSLNFIKPDYYFNITSRSELTLQRLQGTMIVRKMKTANLVNVQINMREGVTVKTGMKIQNPLPKPVTVKTRIQRHMLDL